MPMAKVAEKMDLKYELAAVHRGFPSAHSVVQIIQIIINNHNAVIHYHSQELQQRSQCYRVDFKAQHIEYSYGE